MPAKHNLKIKTGRYFRAAFTRKDSSGVVVDMTGYTARMQIRRKPGTAVIDTLSTANGKIVIGATEGTLDLILEDDETQAYTPGLYVYDIALVDADGRPHDWMEGEVEVVAEVTE